MSPRPLTVLYFGLWTGYFTWFWGHAFRYDGAGSLIAGNANVWADWALHFTLGNAMVERDLLPATSPLMLGQPFGYPFAADLVSALLMKAGVGMLPAFVLPSYACSLLLVAALYFFLRVLLRSPAAAVLGSTLFLLAGGLGFLQFVRDVAASADPLATLLAPPREYTRLAERDIVLLSVIDGMILPQRSFTLGFPLALIALGLIHSGLGGAAGRTGPTPWPRLGVAALILGLMPLIHAHCMLAACVILTFWAAAAVFFGRQATLWQRLRPWLVLGLACALVALPLIGLFLAHAVSGRFLRWYPGWYARELGIGGLTFWIRNWGLMPLLALAGLGWWVAEHRSGQCRGRTVQLVAPFCVLFVLVNLFLFAPWIWDNTKLLVWAALGFCGLAAWFCVRLWQEAGRWRAERPTAGPAAHAVRLAVLAAILVSTASGAIDAWRVLRAVRDGHVLYTREDFLLAGWARRATDPRSVWLTGDRHNHWLINLSGRQPVMAYRGWLWSHGYDYAALERQVARMYATADPALLARHGVDYVVIGPEEREVWKADEQAYARRFPVVLRTPTHVVFHVARGVHPEGVAPHPPGSGDVPAWNSAAAPGIFQLPGVVGRHGPAGRRQPPGHAARCLPGRFDRSERAER